MIRRLVKNYNKICRALCIVDPLGAIVEVALDKAHEKKVKAEIEEKGYYVDDEGVVVLVK